MQYAIHVKDLHLNLAPMGELTPPEKASNRRISSIRIRMEHANGVDWIQGERIGRIGGIDVDGIDHVAGRHEIENGFHQVAVRVDDHQSPVCLEVCGDQAREQGRLAGPRFPKNPEMAKTVRLRDAEGVGVTVMVSLAQDGQVLCGGGRHRSDERWVHSTAGPGS